MVPTLAFLIGLGLGGGITWAYMVAGVAVKIDDFQRESHE